MRKQGHGSRVRRSNNRLTVRQSGAFFKSAPQTPPPGVLVPPPDINASSSNRYSMAPPKASAPSSSSISAAPSTTGISSSQSSGHPSKPAPTTSSSSNLVPSSPSPEYNPFEELPAPSVMYSNSDSGILFVDLQREASMSRVGFTSVALAQLFASCPPTMLRAYEVTRGEGPESNVACIKWIGSVPLLTVQEFTDFLIQWVDDELKAMHEG